MSAAAADDVHPLDPLNFQEITAAVAILKAERELPDETLFPLLSLAEPDKPHLARTRPEIDPRGQPPW